VKLVTTSVIIRKDNLLSYGFDSSSNSICSIKEIRAGINAFTLIEKELKETNIPLKENIILRALRVRLRETKVIFTFSLSTRLQVRN
jgi:hypothetical protein